MSNCLYGCDGRTLTVLNGPRPFRPLSVQVVGTRSERHGYRSIVQDPSSPWGMGTMRTPRIKAEHRQETLLQKQTTCEAEVCYWRNRRRGFNSNGTYLWSWWDWDSRGVGCKERVYIESAKKFQHQQGKRILLSLWWYVQMGSLCLWPSFSRARTFSPLENRITL
jgi:hypothetical protein